METVEYKIEIYASQEKIWEKLWDKDCYANWTQFFTPHFYIKSDWKVNGETYFLIDEHNGMVSTISSLEKPNEIIFQHLGILNDGVKKTSGPEIIEWSGVEEKYFLRCLDANSTELSAIVHIYKKQRAEMDEGFMKGFEILKNICEK